MRFIFLLKIRGFWQLGTLDSPIWAFGCTLDAEFSSSGSTVLKTPIFFPRNTLRKAWEHWEFREQLSHCTLLLSNLFLYIHVHCSLYYSRSTSGNFCNLQPCLAALIMLSSWQMILMRVQSQLYLHSPRRLGAVVTTCQWSGLKSLWLV